jgi:hypothetical protein
VQAVYETKTERLRFWHEMTGSWVELVFALDGVISGVWRTGAGGPSDSLGENGDLYLNESNGDVYQKTDDAYSLVTNILGPQGAPGADGADGADGRTWRNGSGLPDDVVGVDGDYYLRTLDGDVYQRSGGTYSVVGNIKGPQGDQGIQGDTGATGAAGITWRTGSGVPSNGTGQDGDLYLDTATGDVYKRVSGAYGVIVNIQGADGADGSDGAPGADGADGAPGTNGTDGADGSVWRSSSGVPSNSLGVDGDYYLNTANGDVYAKAAGAYSVVANITGPAGADGADGADGAPGATIASGVSIADAGGYYTGTDVEAALQEIGAGGIGGGGAVDAAYAVSHLTADQTLSSSATWTQLTGFTSDHDDIGSGAHVANGFTIPSGEDGLYIIGIAPSFDNASQTGTRGARVKKNGSAITPIWEGGATPTSTEWTQVPLTLPPQALAAGDAITFEVRQDSGSGTTKAKTPTTIWLYRLDGVVGPTGAPGTPNIERSARSSNTILAGTDCSKFIAATASFTQTLTAAAVLGAGWWCYVKNDTTDGTTVLTVDPNGSETIDGLTTIKMYSGEVRLLMCDGSNFTSQLVEGGYAKYATSGTFVVPSGVKNVTIEAIGGGGQGGGGRGGAASSVRQGGGGGGGGHRATAELAGSSLGTPGTSITVTVAAAKSSAGAGGSGANGNPGADGDNTTFGTLVTGYGGGGGGGGSSSSSVQGGGGGGAGEKGSTGTVSGTSSRGGGAHEVGKSGSGEVGAASDAAGGSGLGAERGGGGGGFSSANGLAVSWKGGTSVYGGAGGGGGGTLSSGNVESGGGPGGATGVYTDGGGGGGAGGASNGAAGTAGTDGDARFCGYGGGGGSSQDSGTGGVGGAGGAVGGGGGGGGGGTTVGGAGGAGGRGECRVWYD